MDCFTFLDFASENCSGVKFSKENIEQLFVKLRSKLLEYRVKLLVEDSGKFDKLNRIRFVLSADRYNSDFSVKLVRQSNGLVYQIISQGDNKEMKCELLAVPSNDFNNNYTKTDLEHLIKGGKYKVYPLSDGTTINIYFDKIANEWLFSSKNTFNIGELVWRGAKYNEIIRDVLTFYKEFSFDKLNKSCCYSIGFKHPAFHPFGQPDVYPGDPNKEWIKRAWIISGFNISTKSPLSDSEIKSVGLPEQKILALKSLQTVKCIFSGIVSQCSKANDIFVKDGKIFLGYILRSQNETETGAFSDILFESSLYKDIKSCIYNLPNIKNMVVRQKMKENFKNLNYVILDAYLNFYKRNVFIKLFPQFKMLYDKFDSILQQTVNRIYNTIKSSAKEDDTSEVKIFETKDDEHSFMLANHFITIVQKHYQTTKNEEVGSFVKYQQKVKQKPPLHHQEMKQVVIDKKVVRNLIQHPRYVDIYANIIFS